MIQTLWHNFRPWRIWTSSVILLGLLLVAARCNSTLEPTSTPTAKAEPPEITGFTLDPSGPLFPEARVGIQVNTNCHGRKINNYRWVVGAGEGIIISGNGTTLITYQAPETPGSYEVGVELEYDGGLPVKGSTIVKVVEPMPTSTSPSPVVTITPSISPTEDITPLPLTSPSPVLTITPSTPLASTVTPSPMPSDTPTPTPEAVVISATGLNLRSGPGTNYDPPIDYLSNGEILDITGRIASNEWVQVVPVSRTNTISGWVRALPEYVTIHVDLDNIPITKVPPTPAPFVASGPLSPINLPSYPAPVLTAPDNGIDVNGTFPPLDWNWNGELGENEYFEVRVWHENITKYRPALGWVKVPHFDYNITQELQGKYYWTVLVVEGQDARTKDWWRPETFPYPVWDGKLVRELGPEGEVRFFFYVPPLDICKNCGSPISKDPCPFPPCK
jgi:hypothetical protein